jgi:hypothetical protein
MTVEQFLHELLSSQELTPNQEATLQAHKQEVTNYLRSEFGSAPIIKYAGSYEKGTLISECYDLDIVCYFPSSDQRTLKEIRNEVLSHLEKKYVIQEKASALRILTMKGILGPDYHVDIVPGRFIEGTKDVFLHVAEGERERIQTNLKTHIDFITHSGCVDIIRLIKLWAHRNDISLRTFVLELFVIESLNGFRNKTNIKESFIEVLRAFKENFGKTQLTDPANTNNIVSQLIDSRTKTTVTQLAEASLRSIENSITLEDWEKIFEQNPKNGLIQPFVPSTGPIVPQDTLSTPRPFTPRSPWSAYDNERR